MAMLLQKNSIESLILIAHYILIDTKKKEIKIIIKLHSKIVKKRKLLN